MIFLLEEINTESFLKLIAAYNEAGKTNSFVHIYMNTCGGDMEETEAIIDLINTHKNKTTLTGYGKMYSAGFFIFFRATCDRFLLPGTVGMIHYISTPISIDENKKAYGKEDKAWQVWAKDQNVWTTELFIKLNITQSELLKVKRGEEVYFQYSRLLEFIENGKRG